MATEHPQPQRAYRAMCPNCGAPVELASAASASAVCSFCRSTLVRDGDALRRIGQSAELFDDHSPLRLGAGGKLNGHGFTLVGRLQYAYEGGTWNEWHALFDNGHSGWLSEDNGRYVFVFDRRPQGELPAPDELHAGERRLVDGRAWSVASVTRAKLLAAEGELPRPPQLQGEFVVADLRNEQGEVGTIDYADQPPQWSVGRAVALSQLAMSGLADTSEKTLKSRSIECPSCGASLEVQLATTQSIVCGQCKSVVDISQGVGADLKHFKQNAAGELDHQPQIPLGSTGTLRLGKGEAVPWQVVGYMERCDLPTDAEDEQTFWREYLLYNRQEGFAFLVDAEDGWSWVVPATGAPQLRGDRAQLDGVDYRKRYTYSAKTTYVLGEFYWKVAREQRTINTDYAGVGKDADKRLNREMAGTEVTWSAGETIDAEAVAAAFRIPKEQRAALQRDVAPAAVLSSSGAIKLVFIFFVIVVLLLLFSRCSRDDCDQVRSTFGEASTEYQQCRASYRAGGYRSSGGSFGGHK